MDEALACKEKGNSHPKQEACFGLAKCMLHFFRQLNFKYMQDERRDNINSDAIPLGWAKVWLSHPFGNHCFLLK